MRLVSEMQGNKTWAPRLLENETEGRVTVIDVGNDSDVPHCGWLRRETSSSPASSCRRKAPENSKWQIDLHPSRAGLGFTQKKAKGPLGACYA
jgi:hypothetical protein